MGAIFHQGQPTRLAVLGSEFLTVSTSVVPLADIPTSGDHLSVFIEVQEAGVRWMINSDPTSTAGHYLAAGDTCILSVDPALLRFVRDDSETTDATLVVDYLGV